MKAPAYWNNSPEHPGWQAKLLAPFGALYAAATARNVARQSFATNPGIPVICVGNINAGGTGKTPTVIALVGLLSDMNKTAHVVSRGYGGHIEGPVQVDPNTHKAENVGDEPLLIAAFAPTWVAKERPAGIRAAAQSGADVIILDDGFQNPGVNPDFALIVVDAVAGFGNGQVIPAGPLREPVAIGLRRASHLLTIGDETAQSDFAKQWGHAITVPSSKARLVPLPTGIPFTGMRVFPFAGIGRPEKFFATLKEMGAVVTGARALDDHQELTPTLLSRIEREASSLNAQLVTTEKDAVRLPSDWKRKVLTVPVRLELDDPEPLMQAVSDLF